MAVLSGSQNNLGRLSDEVTFPLTMQKDLTMEGPYYEKGHQPLTGW